MRLITWQLSHCSVLKIFSPAIASGCDTWISERVWRIEDEAHFGKPEVGAIDLDHRRAPDVRGDACGGRAQRLAVEAVDDGAHACRSGSKKIQAVCGKRTSR